MEQMCLVLKAACYPRIIVEVSRRDLPFVCLRDSGYKPYFTSFI